jgi:hypothetical protein
VPNIKTRKRRSGDSSEIDDSKTNLLVEHYYPKYTLCTGKYAVSQWKPGTHENCGPPVVFFAPKGSRKYWIKTSTPVLRCLFYITNCNYMHFFSCNMQHFCIRYFLFLVLDKAVCPFLVKTYDMPIWHRTCEKTLDALHNAQVDV